MAGIVYVLTNSAMPRLVKIGKTTQEDPRVRMNQLYTTGVPVPFDCVKAVKVEDEGGVEKALQAAFGPYRVNNKREFYEIDEFQASALLDVLGEDVTPQVKAAGEEDINPQEREAANRLSSKRPRMNFEEMSIPAGSILNAVNSEDTAEVMDHRKVIFRGEEMSLTSATRIMLELDYSPRPNPHWRFNGELLSDIYDKTYTVE